MMFEVRRDEEEAGDSRMGTSGLSAVEETVGVCACGLFNGAVCAYPTTALRHERR